MRNLLGGLVGAAIGCFVIVWLQKTPQPVYPKPFDMIWFLFAGSSLLQTTLADPLAWNSFMRYFTTWIIVGIAITPFSRPNWNALRTALWVGVFLALFATASVLITNPYFWSSQTRNMSLVSLFITSLITALLSLVSCIPIGMFGARLLNSEVKPPEKIETVCQCGAVFKSRPMFCSECVRQLAVLSADETTHSSRTG
jgi:hypothetical protein